MKQALLIIGLILFIACIGFLVGALAWSQSLDYNNSKTRHHCRKHHSSTSEGGNCGVWDGVQCRRGRVRNGKCVAKSNPGPFALFITSIVALILAIVLLSMSFTMKSPQSALSSPSTGMYQIASRYY
jgi:high-affinity Fe2+/Pb2+ permease